MTLPTLTTFFDEALSLHLHRVGIDTYSLSDLVVGHAVTGEQQRARRTLWCAMDRNVANFLSCARLGSLMDRGGASRGWTLGPPLSP